MSALLATACFGYGREPLGDICAQVPSPSAEAVLPVAVNRRHSRAAGHRRPDLDLDVLHREIAVLEDINDTDDSDRISVRIRTDGHQR
ncbi:MAG: hypothetical protein LBJ08_04180 [Bifidobacteriaceae bacterium]|nr:hypothetical protein [Bifidobacteriaceae bacterium]